MVLDWRRCCYFSLRAVYDCRSDIDVLSTERQPATGETAAGHARRPDSEQASKLKALARKNGNDCDCDNNFLYFVSCYVSKIGALCTSVLSAHDNRLTVRAKTAILLDKVTQQEFSSERYAA